MSIVDIGSIGIDEAEQDETGADQSRAHHPHDMWIHTVTQLAHED